MCGIAGIYAYHPSAPPVSADELLLIREHMLTRGPDGAGIWISTDTRIGLAHRRLSIIDLSDTGAQPMVTDGGQFRIIFNGEIYNYRELRRELEGKGFRFRSTSDTEVLLHLYADRGAEMVHVLRGMYVFAIWDERKRGLFLARDPFGIKPLYYADDGSTMRVASQVKALLKGSAIDTTMEPAGHVGFFLWGHVPEPYTLYKGIRALPAGTTMWIDAAGRRECRKFFSLTDELAKAGAVPQSLHNDEIHERLRFALRDSVRCHLIADVDVGVFLSSGLDSTTLTALAKEVGDSAVRTITLGFREFKGTRDDEVPVAELVARHYGTFHQTHWLTKEDFRGQYQSLLNAMDQPTIDGVNSYFVSKAAIEAGVKVVLSGIGGDELFGGYASFKQIPRLVRSLNRFRYIPSLGRGFRYLSAPILKYFTSPKYAGLLEFGGTYGGAYLLRRGMYMPWELPSVLDGDIVRQGWQELQTLSRLDETTDGVGNSRLKVTALEAAWYMRNQLLRDADWASMAHSLELRVPFVDIELFRSVASLSNSTSSLDKLAMARAPEVPLPSEVLKREKTGFSVPMREWLTAEIPAVRNSGRAREWAKIVFERMTRKKRALISTLLPTGGGVTTMTLRVVEYLQYRGYEVALACYLPYRLAPNLSVPFWRLSVGSPGCRVTAAFNGIPCYEIGAYLPELEFARCFPTSIWRDVSRRFDFHLAVSGSVHAAIPFLLQKKPCLAWVATPYLPDKMDRVKGYPWYRRIVDRLLDTPVCEFLERRGLKESKVLALSSYTASALQKITPEIQFSRMSISIDVEKFSPMPGDVVIGRIGFSGRLSDKRKNLRLLVDAMYVCRARGFNITATLAGAVEDELKIYVQQRNLTECIDFLGFVDNSAMSDFYRALDVFVIPSFQEGLGIVGPEAMACGCPVVSTRCGGAEDYVRDDVNGYLVGFSAEKMADAICKIVGDRVLRERLSVAAIDTVKTEFSQECMKQIFWDAFEQTYGVARENN